MEYAGSHADTASAAAAAARSAMPAPLPQHRVDIFAPYADVENEDMDMETPWKISVKEQPQKLPRSRSGQQSKRPPAEDPPMQPPMQDDFGMFYSGAMGMPYPQPYAGMPAMPYGMGPMAGMPWPYPSPMFPQMQGPPMFYPSMGMMGVPPMGMGQGHGHQAGAGPATAPAAKTKNSRDRRGRGSKARGREEEDGGGHQQALDPDEANAARSAELVEVRKVGATKCKLPLARVVPHIQEFAKDQHGSRFLQTRLESPDTTQDEKQMVFEAILPEANHLAGDSFAHFVVQKLFEVGTPEQKEELVLQLKDDILRLCKESCGCRVVQKAIAHLQRETQIVIAKELEKDVIGCIENPHGNHVIQKCIEQMNPDSVRFIVEKIEKETVKMAKHMYGCRVIQRLLEHFSVSDLGVILERVLEAVPDLAEDSYGNYVIQHMLDHSKLEDKKKIIMAVTKDVVKFSKLKHASNVVEKCFEVATAGGNDDLETERAALFESVVGKPGVLPVPLYQILDDKYGNYIVQRMIEFSTRSTEKGALKQCLSAPEVYHLLSSGHTSAHKHVFEAYKKYFGDPRE